MKKKPLLTAIIALVVLIGSGAYLFYFKPKSTPTPEPTTTHGKASMVLYQDAAHGVFFEYPSNLYLFEKEAGTPERPQHAIVLVENTEENRAVIEGRSTEPREGPTAITIDIYQNPQSLSAADWVKTDTNWTVANSGATEVTVGSMKGITYTWSGLYEGKTIVLTKGTRAYVLAVTWMSPEDQLLKDFDMVLNSLHLQ